MGRPRADIVKEIEKHLRPLKPSAVSMPARRIEWIITLATDTSRRGQQAHIVAISRRANKAHEALEELRGCLVTDPDNMYVPFLFSEAPQVIEAIDAIDPKLAQLSRFKSNQWQPLRWDCALCAYVLMRELSTRMPVSSPGSRFRVIASLVFEWVTGTQVKDLKRACDNVMRFHKPKP